MDEWDDDYQEHPSKCRQCGMRMRKGERYHRETHHFDQDSGQVKIYLGHDSLFRPQFVTSEEYRVLLDSGKLDSRRSMKNRGIGHGR